MRMKRAGTLPPLVRKSFEELLAKARAGRSDDECWPWPGNISVYGYGRYGQAFAHRRAYEENVAPIPDGMQPDHTCHTHDESCAGGKNCMHRRCVNYLQHLELVTPLENWERGRSPSRRNVDKDRCDNGHELTADNVYLHLQRGRIVRICRTCRLASNARSRS